VAAATGAAASRIKTMASVTVTGANNHILTVQLNGVTNFTVAQQFAAIINDAAAGSTLTAYDAGPGAASPALAHGNLGEAVVLTAQPDVHMPDGYIFLTDVAATATTVTGANNGFNGVLSGTQGVTLDAGTANGLFVAGGGANTFNGAATAGANGSVGSYFVATGDGRDTINAGVGNDTIDAGAGANVINLGSGASVVLSESNDQINAGSGTGLVFLEGSHATVAGSTGSLMVAATGAYEQVSLGAGGGTIFGGTQSTYNLAGSAAVIGSDGVNTINVNQAAATVFAGTGNDMVFGPTGTGSLTFIGGAGSSTVVGGSVAVTLFGADGGTTTLTGTGANLVGVGTGAKVDASMASGANVFFGGAAASTILGGTGADVFVVGAGATSLTGGAGAANMFDFVASATAGATDVISDFKASDKLAISGYKADAAADVLRSATVSGGSTTVTLSDQTKIVFQNYTNLNAGNFS
jgi:Ca2+-binding RTX toxin-like protein